MNQSLQQTWSTLQEVGIVNGDAPEQGNFESPWYVKALLAFSGWLASLFILGFIGSAFVFVIKNEIMSFIVGGIMIAVSYKLLSARKNEFYEHMALSVSLAGQALVIFAFIKLYDSNITTFLTLIVILQATLAIVMPNFVHRVGSSMAAGIAFSIVLMSLKVAYMSGGVLMFAVAWLWLNEFKHPQHIKAIRAIGYGLILALLPLKSKEFINEIFFFLFNDKQEAITWLQPWMGELLTSAALLYVVWRIMQRYHLPVSSLYYKVVIAGTLVLCGLSLEAQGITVAVMIVLLGFSTSNHVLQGLGIASFLYYISSYYYMLNITLVEKSQILLIMGITMLAARWFLRRYLPADEDIQHV